MTFEEYQALAKAQDRLKVELTVVATKIAHRLHYDTEIYGITCFGPFKVEYEFNNGCRCHGETASGTFPAEWLFDPNWEEKWKAECAARNKAAEELKAKKDAEYKLRVEADERNILAELKAKYEKEKP